jgi:hypothetical protein
MGLYQIKKLLHTKGNSYQNEEAAYKIRENLCQLFIRQEVNTQMEKFSEAVRHANGQ